MSGDKAKSNGDECHIGSPSPHEAGGTRYGIPARLAFKGRASRAGPPKRRTRWQGPAS